MSLSLRRYNRGGRHVTLHCTLGCSSVQRLLEHAWAAQVGRRVRSSPQVCSCTTLAERLQAKIILIAREIQAIQLKNVALGNKLDTVKALTQVIPPQLGKLNKKMIKIHG